VVIGSNFTSSERYHGGIAERKAMIDREHDLPISKQAEALNISRGSVYYLPRPVSPKDLALMRRLDRLHLEFPLSVELVVVRPGMQRVEIGDHVPCRFLSAASAIQR
jgi:putative transposase